MVIKKWWVQFKLQPACTLASREQFKVSRAAVKCVGLLGWDLPVLSAVLDAGSASIVQGTVGAPDRTLKNCSVTAGPVACRG